MAVTSITALHRRSEISGRSDRLDQCIQTRLNWYKPIDPGYSGRLAGHWNLDV
jgi:hypothetical protein